METYFAPAARALDNEVQSHYQDLINHPELPKILDSISVIIAILNKERQIVYVNKKFIGDLEISEVVKILGKRPGEIVNCVHSTETIAGCGTSESCKYCGAVQAIVNSQKTQKTHIEECRITSIKDGSCIYYDLQVIASPVNLNGLQYTVLSIEDISEKKRKRVLERIFFHDIINSAGGVSAFLDHLKQCDDPDMVKRFTEKASRMSNLLIEEIFEQKDLIAAENNELKVKVSSFSNIDILNETIDQIHYQRVARNKIIELEKNIKEIQLKTDRVLLRRILLNMLKNALEASSDGDIIRIGSRIKENNIIFSVNNPVMIPHDIQLQIFKRSFSTKGADRGIGTYSMKLLSEKFLKGKIDFTTSENEGTTFFIEINTSLN